MAYDTITIHPLLLPTFPGCYRTCPRRCECTRGGTSGNMAPETLSQAAKSPQVVPELTDLLAAAAAGLNGDDSGRLGCSARSALAENSSAAQLAWGAGAA